MQMVGYNEFQKSSYKTQLLSVLLNFILKNKLYSRKNNI